MNCLVRSDLAVCRRSAVTGLWFTLLCALTAHCVSARWNVHPFYLDMLDKGIDARETGELRQASRTLRVACFGLLEEPELLARCLVHLAVTEGMMAKKEGFLEAYGKLRELERRFGAYRQVDIGEGVRAEFEVYVRHYLPESRRAELLAPPVVQKREAKVAKAPEKRQLDLETAGKMKRIKGLMAEARFVSDLEAALVMAREVADAHPESREAQFLAAEIAYRSSDWEQAVAYFERAGDLDARSYLLLFFKAVALYETGRITQAAPLLRRSLRGLERTPFVESYVAKILLDGDPAAVGPTLSQAPVRSFEKDVEEVVLEGGVF